MLLRELRVLQFPIIDVISGRGPVNQQLPVTHMGGRTALSGSAVESAYLTPPVTPPASP